MISIKSEEINFAANNKPLFEAGLWKHLVDTASKTMTFTRIGLFSFLKLIY